MQLSIKRQRFSTSFRPFLESNHLLSGINTSVPTITQTMPTGRKEKKESGSSPAEVNVFCFTRFGGLPIKVIIPPIHHNWKNRRVLRQELISEK